MLLRLIRIIAAGIIMSSASAHAADPPPLTPGSQWSSSVSLYGWAAGLDVDQQQSGLPAQNVSIDFDDPLSYLDFAFMSIIEIRRGQVGFVGDLNYFKFSGSHTGPAGYTTLHGDISSVMGLAAMSYRVTEAAWGHVDLMGGVRIFSLEDEVKLSAFNRSLQASDSESWADAVVGAKMRYTINENWFLNTWGLIGTGGADLDWDLLAAIGYQFNQRWSMSAGYRALGVDYEHGDSSYDVVQSGPLLGVTARF